ncbi:MAG: 30S ribosomal protein S16 [Actinobacteria bacterium]|nr:30S ribosomal protein S16 [Actinomycetota bacterium]
MAVKIKLKRVGKVHAPQYRVVVADSRTARNGRAIEEIGIYQPLEDPSIIRVDSDRVQYWLGVGAQPTEAVAAILKVTGDWQKFKGEPGAEGTLQVAEPKADKKVAYEAAVKEAASEPKTPAPAKAKPKEDAVSEEAAEEPAAQAAQEAEAAPAEAPADAPAEAPAAEAAEEAADAPAEAPAEEPAAEAAEASAEEASE